MSLADRLAAELDVPTRSVTAAVGLIDDGATVPFIARYRKEATGGLDDAQLRALAERLTYHRDLDATRTRILDTLAERGVLTPDLRQRLLAADSKARLDDLYAPFRSSRKTKADVAREAGLAPLATLLRKEPHRNPSAEARRFVNPAKGVADADAALDGARDVLVQKICDDADLVGWLRDDLAERGVIRSKVVKGKEQEGARFRDWFDFSESIRRIPSHRALALFRGEREGVLKLSLEPGGDPEATIRKRTRIQDRGRRSDAWLVRTVEVSWRSRLKSRVGKQVRGILADRAHDTAIEVFARNLSDVLLAAPAGQRVTLGLDPGIRTGVKVAVVDGTGKVIDTDTIYPFPPRRDVEGATEALRRLITRHRVALIAIGNGTGSRETDRLVADLLKSLPAADRPTKVVVSEAGASVYSASALASAELPGLDVTLRGAVSIARRLQDPLAELVKIDPRSIGVGQYQHDVPEDRLASALDAVVEDCVNAVGVDLNTASPALLQRVAGLGETLADNIVAWRDTNGAFDRRGQLMEVPRLGRKTFEQCAGFLRVRGGSNPLDASAVHPEARDVVKKIARDTGLGIDALIGHPRLSTLDPARYTDDRFGLPTVRDILAELDKPGRDPRPAFETAELKEGIETLDDLAPGMVLQGTVSNVAAFGAFVDLGVHQDGLVHVSRMADRFVRDPHEIVRAGQVVTVKVLEVDHRRKRISLTLRLDD